jgi:hypothetical protein
MKVEDFILDAFNKDIDKDGLFWRIVRPNTFVDLIMLEAYKASKNGIDIELALKVVITSLKAIINDKLGILDYNLDYEYILCQVSSEKDSIIADVKSILLESIEHEVKMKNSHFDELNYFKVLNNLDLDNYSIEIFKNILDSFIHYIKSKI